MVSKAISKDALAFIFDSESIDNEYIIFTIKNELKKAGLELWENIEADLFTSDNKLLVIARPAPPLCKEGIKVRLRRTR